ncbi:unnamed protein product [Linum trigynum]|uniref:Uncharacterized protein n=1 Tax=Linum trigynum TaxID=586398 RepID=A0AAV2GB63_9ROSI
MPPSSSSPATPPPIKSLCLNPSTSATSSSSNPFNDDPGAMSPAAKYATTKKAKSPKDKGINSLIYPQSGKAASRRIPSQSLPHPQSPSIPSRSRILIPFPARFSSIPTVIPAIPYFSLRR